MTWDHPQLLFALWLLPALLLVMLLDYRARRRAAERFAGQWLVAHLVPRPGRARLAIKTAALLLGLALLLAAAARPRFGTYFEEVTAQGIDLVVLLDVSRSMQAEDVAPNRLLRAVSDVRDLLPKLQGDRVALIVFADAPLVRVPLTTDQAFLRQALDSIDPDSGPGGGSALGDAIRKALEILPSASDRDQALLLITDGEDHDSFPKEAARQAAERNIKLFAVGLGDADQGARIPIRDADGNRTYLQYEGQEVWSKVDRRLLTELALETGGAYVPAHTRAYDLGQVYEDHLSRLTRGQLHGGKRQRYRDQFPWFLGMGLALLLLDMAIPGYPRSSGHEAHNGA